MQEIRTGLYTQQTEHIRDDCWNVTVNHGEDRKIYNPENYK
jgi:hypothetical protein